MSKKNKNNKNYNGKGGYQKGSNDYRGYDKDKSSDMVDHDPVRGYDSVRGGRTKIRNSGDSNTPKIMNKATGRNDVRWHVHDEEELKQIASWSYPQAMGIPFQVRGELYNPSGLCVADVTPTYGYSDSPESAMNQGVRKVYGAMRSKNSGQAMETPTAYGFYIMAFDSVHYLLNHVQRAFQLSTIFPTRNRYFPRVIMQSLGFSYNDVSSNKPNYVAKYNNCVRAAAAWNVPSNFTIFDRHAYLFGNFFKDSDQAKDQIYAYRPTGYYVYDEVNEDGIGSELKWMPIDYYNPDGTAKTYTLAEWMSFIDDAISHLVRAKSAQNCSGDTEKAFDSGSLLKLSLISGEEPPSISLDDDAREMFMNATVVGQVFDLGITENISDNVNEDVFFVTTPKVYNNTHLPHGDEYLVSTYRDNPTPANNLEITRFMHPTDYIDGVSEASPVALTTQLPDVVESYIIITLDANNMELSSYVKFGPTLYIHDNVNSNGVDRVNSGQVDSMLNAIAKWNMFDYAPHTYIGYRVYDVMQPGDNEPATYHDVHIPLVKLTNYTTISKSKLREIANITIQKMFGF